MSKPRKLTPKQARFVEEYPIDLNATAAAKRAGYSERTAKETGYENLTKPHVLAAIVAKLQDRSDRTEVRADNVLREVAALAFADVHTFYDWDEDGPTLKDVSELPEGATRSVRGVKVREVFGKDGDTVGRTVELTLHDKGAQLKLLMEHLGMLVKRVAKTDTEGKDLPRQMMRFGNLEVEF